MLVNMWEHLLVRFNGICYQGIVNRMGKRNNNNLIYVNIQPVQQPSGGDCSSTLKTTETTEYYDHPFYTLNQLKALK